MSYSSSRSTVDIDDLTPGQWARYGCGAVVALIAFIALICVGVAGVGAFDSIDAGHIAVLRNGGFANQNIRGFLNPGSGATWTGFYSTERIYPAQQLVYTVSEDPNQGSTPTADEIEVPSSDGVNITIQGTLYYELNLDHKVLGEFDDRYGSQTYEWDGKALHPYDGAAGWNGFINTVVRPTLQNELRTAMAQFSCADVDSACSLVKNATAAQPAAAQTGGASSVGNLVKIQNQINSELAADLENQLGGEYLTNLRFTISAVALPANVQDAINKAQAAFADVSTAQANVNTAQLNAKANQIAQQGYSTCPACAVIAEEKALPPGITTYAPGGALAVGAH